MVSTKFSSSPAYIVAIVVLILVMVLAPSIDAGVCYEIHHEVPCDGGNIDPVCKPFCQKTFGAKFAGAQCQEAVGVDPFCACSFTC
nr:putative defensin-like protein 120 [Ipomoea trifida]